MKNTLRPELFDSLSADVLDRLSARVSTFLESGETRA